MRLKFEYPMVEMDGEAIIVFTPDDNKSFRGMLRLNPTAKFIYECLRYETSEELILQSLMERFEGSESEMRQDISMLLEKLRTAGALEE